MRDAMMILARPFLFLGSYKAAFGFWFDKVLPASDGLVELRQQRRNENFEHLLDTSSLLSCQLACLLFVIVPFFCEHNSPSSSIADTHTDLVLCESLFAVDSRITP